MMITQKNPVHAALSFALVVLSTCGLFLLQAAPFLMAATIIVYAGAIVVTFLFVIMLAQQEGPSDADQRTREPFLASLAGGVLLAALVCVLHKKLQRHRPAKSKGSTASSSAKIAEASRTPRTRTPSRACWEGRRRSRSASLSRGLVVDKLIGQFRDAGDPGRRARTCRWPGAR